MSLRRHRQRWSGTSTRRRSWYRRSTPWQYDENVDERQELVRGSAVEREHLGTLDVDLHYRPLAGRYQWQQVVERDRSDRHRLTELARPQRPFVTSARRVPRNVTVSVVLCRNEHGDLISVPVGDRVVDNGHPVGEVSELDRARQSTGRFRVRFDGNHPVSGDDDRKRVRADVGAEVYERRRPVVDGGNRETA